MKHVSCNQPVSSKWARSDGPDTPELQEFANIYDRDQKEIVRIFSYLLGKYPVNDSVPDAFNYMFMALYDLKVFQRWSVARVVAAEVRRRTKDEVKAKRVLKKLTTAGNDEAEVVALKMGINLKRKRGQFLYKWVEKVMGDHYRKIGKQCDRFSRHDEDTVGTPAWSSNKRDHGFLAWDPRANDADPEDHGNGTGAWGVPVNHRRRVFPTYDDAFTCVSQFSSQHASGFAEDQLQARQTARSVAGDLDEIDLEIVTRKLQGYSAREIARQFSATPGMPQYTHQSIQNHLKHIRQSRHTAKPATKKRAKTTV